ncbi:MAG: hypothetical protein CFH35_01853 [Alphaproteobacteria bacterium MarineAlpha9_Bin5]|nr:MAG: hypothetical protein CFH35_01853 [Alphaproteobacteria bacterium MarineAlpha9_Bin5]
MKVSQRKNIKLDSDLIIRRLAKIHEVDTDADLSVKLGVARGTISSWRARGQVPWRECLEAAISSDVSLDWLVIGRGAKCSRLGGSTGEDLGQTSVSQGKEGARFTNPYSNYLVNEYSLITKGGIKIGEAGDVLPFPHNAFPVAFKSKYLANLAGELVGPCYGYLCTDDAMAPTIPEGWCVLVADTKGEIGESGIYGLLFRDTGQQTFRRVTPVGDALHLCCDNPNQDPLILDATHQPLPILVLGRAIWSGGVLA